MRIIARKRGSVLVAVLILAVVVSILCMVTMMISSSESRGANAAVLRDKALFVASAGVEDELHSFGDFSNMPFSANAFASFDALAGQTVITNRPLTSDGVASGEYTVVVNSVAVPDAYHREITLTSTGYVPSAGSSSAVKRTVQVVVRIGYDSSSDVFNFVRFTNNYGWFGDSQHKIRGNVGSNGECDFANRKWDITPYPRFKGYANGHFTDVRDEGGVYAGYDVTGDNHVKFKVKGKLKNDDASDFFIHPFEQKVTMPSITSLAPYEADAIAHNSNIKINNSVVCDAVVGDEPSEKSNLFLQGTDQHPIVLNGTVVVRGDLVIQGTVTGKGSFYVGGNIYVAGNLKYAHKMEPPPDRVDLITTTDPNGFPKAQKQMEDKLNKNATADALGLFTQNNIVVGDFTDKNWSDEISDSLTNPHIGNGEDNGIDGIPNTRAGADGILGTADDDVLESDGQWTVDHYTEAQQKAGLIPPGFKKGDPIPGTGEDANGDGQYNSSLSETDFELNTALNSGQFEGNVPNGNKKYKDIGEKNDDIKQLDGVFFAGNAFAIYSKHVKVNGAIIAGMSVTDFKRHDMELNYDLRLLIPDSPSGRQLPRSWEQMQVIMWKSN